MLVFVYYGVAILGFSFMNISRVFWPPSSIRVQNRIPQWLEFGPPRFFVIFVPGSVGVLLAFFGLFWPSSLFGVFAGIIEVLNNVEFHIRE